MRNSSKNLNGTSLESRKPARVSGSRRLPLGRTEAAGRVEGEEVVMGKAEAIEAGEEEQITEA